MSLGGIRDKVHKTGQGLIVSRVGCAEGRGCDKRGTVGFLQLRHAQSCSKNKVETLRCSFEGKQGDTRKLLELLRCQGHDQENGVGMQRKNCF